MKRIKLIATICACLFIFFPIVEMFLNLSGMKGADSYRIWLMLLYIPAAVGILLGYLHTRKVEIYKPPIIFMFAFGIWCLICTTRSETMALSLFGFVPASDSISVYLSYFGMIMLGLILGEEKKYALIVGKAFIVVTFILSVLSLIDSRTLDPLFINESTNCFHYQAVYFNTNQFGYHLSIALIINIYLFEYAEKIIEKVLYLVCFIVLSNMLILNNTMGAYIAILLVLFFAVIWSFINKEDKKMPGAQYHRMTDEEIFQKMIKERKQEYYIAEPTSYQTSEKSKIYVATRKRPLAKKGMGTSTSWIYTCF